MATDFKAWVGRINALYAEGKHAEGLPECLALGKALREAMIAGEIDGMQLKGYINQLAETK